MSDDTETILRDMARHKGLPELYNTMPKPGREAYLLFWVSDKRRSGASHTDELPAFVYAWHAAARHTLEADVDALRARRKSLAHP